MDDPIPLHEPGFRNPIFGNDPSDDVDDSFDAVDEIEDPSNQEPKVEDKRNLYAILNLKKDATDEDIKESYRRLSMIYHPDRHSTSPERRKVAELKFPEIQRAYEVLTDSSKRAAYDMFGEEGLKHNWTIGPKLKSPAEMAEEFKRQKRIKKFTEMENLVRPKGSMAIKLDATSLFSPEQVGALRLPQNQNASLVQRARMTTPYALIMRHSFEMHPHSRVSIGLAEFAHLNPLRGVGEGNIVGTVRMQFSSKLWTEIAAPFTSLRNIISKGLYQHSPNSYVTWEAQVMTWSIPPLITMTAGRRIAPHTNGYLTYKTGIWVIPGIWDGYPPSYQQPSFQGSTSSTTLGIQTVKPGYSYGASMTAGIQASNINLELTRKIWGLISMRMGSTLATDTIFNSYICGEGRVTQHTRLELGLEFTLVGDMNFFIRFRRLGQRVYIPITVSRVFKPRLALWLIAAPLVAVAALNRMYILPKKTKSREQKLRDLREYHKEYLEERRKEALEALRLMEDSVARRKAQEVSTDGLVIVFAYYGSADAIDAAYKESQISNDERNSVVANGSVRSLSTDIIDVTMPVQGLVSNSQLCIHGGFSKSHIFGFYDPCLGERKRLFIRYRFHQRLHEVVVDDKLTVIAPLRAHQI